MSSDRSRGRHVSGFVLLSLAMAVFVTLLPGRAQPVAAATPGSALAWGDNVNGQLGDGSGITQPSPVGVHGLTNVTSLAGGGLHSLAVKYDGTLWAWGNNQYGQLGTGFPTPKYLLPVQVPVLGVVSAVAAGDNHSLALIGGAVWAWGSNNHGQLGINSTVDKHTPMPVTGLGPGSTLAIAAGGDHSMAFMSDGSVRAWGDNSHGQVGDPSKLEWDVPTQVIAGPSSVLFIAAGKTHSLALNSDGSVLAWGSNVHGQVGNGSLIHKDQQVPTPVIPPTPPLTPGVYQIAAGGDHSLAVKDDHSVMAWGSNVDGQLGDNSHTDALSPQPVPAFGGATMVAAGGYHSQALKSDGSVWAWGDNSYGQLGDGTGMPRLIPVPVSSLGPGSTVVALAPGGYHSLAVFVGGQPTVTSNSPGSLLQGAWHQTVSITGTNFVSGASVAISGGVTVNSTSFLDATHLFADISIPANAAVGSRTVTVTNPDGGIASCAGCFNVAFALYVSSVMADNPELYWRMDDVAPPVAHNSSAFPGRDATYVGTVAYASPGSLPDDPDSAITLGGAGYVQYLNSAGLMFGTPPRSVELWFNTAVSTLQPLLNYGSSARADAQFAVRLQGTQVIFDGGGTAEVATFTSPNSLSDGAWHHLVLTADKTVNGAVALVTAYVDGLALPATGASRQGYGVALGVLQTLIGSNGLRLGKDDVSNFSGSLDEVAIYSKALTAANVTTHFKAGANLSSAPSGVTVVPGNRQATVTWQAPAPRAISTITNYTVAAFSGLLQPAEQVTVDGNARSATVTGLSGGSTYTFEVWAWNLYGRGGAGSSIPTVIGGSPLPSYTSTVLGDSPSIYWRLDEPNIWRRVTDYSPAGGRDGFVLGSVLDVLRAQPGALANDADGAVSLNPTCTPPCTGYLQYPWSTGLPSSSSSRSLEIWFKTSVPTLQALLTYGTNPRTAQFTVRLQGAQVIFDASGTAEVATFTSPNSLSDGAWHHLVLTAGPGPTGAQSLVTAYVDSLPLPGIGGPKQGNGVLLGLLGTQVDPINGLRLGKDDSNSFSGSLDEFALYPIALTAVQVAAHFAASGGLLVTSQPADQTVTVGATATFTSAASGTPTPTVQWQLSTDGGTTFSNVAGATSTTLTIPNTTVPMSGNKYRAVFTSSLFTATSNTATLTVNPLPSPPVVTSQPTDQTVVASTAATFTSSASGYPTPTVQWQVSTNGGTTFTNVAGATTTTLTIPSTTVAMSGNKYRAVFTNPTGTAMSNAATLTVTAAVGPAVTTQPTDQTVIAGATATFSSAASGSPSPTVQWQVSTNGGTTFSNVAGGTTTTLTIPSTTVAMSGYKYRAVFTNSAGTATSNAATLTVTVPRCTNATLISDKTSPQPGGTTVKFTGVAAGPGCTNPLFQFWTWSAAAGWVMQQAYSSTNSWSLNTNGMTPGTISVDVWVEQSGSSVTTNSYETFGLEAWVIGGCDFASMTPNPAPAMGIVHFVASAGGSGCGTPLYQFWLWAPATGFVIRQPYSTANTWDLDTSTLTGTTYTVDVWVKQQGSPLGYETWALSTIPKGGACGSGASTTVTATQSSPRSVGGIIDFTTVNTGCISPRYRYWIYPGPMGGWEMLQDYSPSGVAHWPTNGLKPGTYSIAVHVRQATSTAVYDTDGLLSYSITGATSATLSASPGSPQAAGTPVTLTASALGSAPLYQFWVYTPSTGWTMVQNFSSTPTFNWITLGLAKGTYSWVVYVQQKGSGNAFDTYALLSVSLT